MPIAFFVSSAGDADLAKATIAKLIEKQPSDPIFLVPATIAAQDRTKDLMASPFVTYKTLAEITQEPNILSEKQIPTEDIEKVVSFIEGNGIKHAYIGVPSPLDEEKSLQIAHALKIPCTIAYEYMFTIPDAHRFWDHVDTLATKENCAFAVPVQAAKEDILKRNSHAKIYPIGHLTIDAAFGSEKALDVQAIRRSLLDNENDELAFISGTTQPTAVDQQFLDALLSEISTGKYPHLQLHFGLHPGIVDMDNYLKTLLETCAKYPGTESQLKIILTPTIEGKLKNPLPESKFILRVNVSGPDAAQSADKVAQAVPGALLNEAAIKGKPAYFHEASMPYLPVEWFSQNIATFFTAKPQPPHTREEIELKEESVTEALLTLMENKM